MSDGKQMNDVSFQLKRVDDAIIADAKPVALWAFQPMMRETFKVRAKLINPVLDACLDRPREFEKNLVKGAIINRSGPQELSGFRTRAY